MHVPGTKTAESECYLPMSPALQQELKTYLAMRTDTSPYLLPERSAQAKGKKIYSRRRLFEKIKRTTAFNVCTATMKAWKELKKDNYPGGVKLSTKELRDYFATQVSAHGERSEHGQESNAPHKPQHHEPLHQNGDGTHD